MSFLKKRKAAEVSLMTPSTSTDSGCSEMQTSSSEPSDSQHSRPTFLGSELFPETSWQGMVTVEKFIEFIKKNDIARIRFTIRESDFQLDTRDADGRTPLHHAVVHGVMENDLEVARHLLQFGSDVNIKDETPHRESPMHIAIRLGHLEAIKMLLESPFFDVTRCDSLQKTKMLPAVCVIKDIYSGMDPLPDSDSTLTKRRSFGDQYLLFTRQNTRDYMENNFPPGRESIRDMIIIQDECVPPLTDMLHRIDYVQLQNLFIVDCKLRSDEIDIFDKVSLTCLVLSHTNLRQLPRSIFTMESLEKLKVDYNRLDEISPDIGNLTNLKSFCCDSQRPRLRSLPVHSITKLDNLQILSFSNNRIDNISWAVGLPNLRVLKCDKNRINRLPNQLANMRDLMVLDVSHNRLECIPPCFTDLIKRLYKFEFYNFTLRPKHIRDSRSQLLAHLELENFLLQSPVRRTVRDITVAIMGESHSGKSTLVEALRSDKGICKAEVRQESTFEIHQFDMQSSDGSCYISTIVLANDILDFYSRNINVDLYLLVIDLTTFELQNGSHHLFARHISRMNFWLQALYEVAPDTPVLIVGTHADIVKTMTFQDIWLILQDKCLDQGRAHHIKRFMDARHNNCLLCNPKDMSVRQVIAKSRSGSAGFVDLSFPHGEPIMNGHVQTGDSLPPPRMKLPHIVGYYEIDSKKNLPKDLKKNNISVEQLKGAIIRLTASCLEEGVPPNWLQFIRQVSSQHIASLPCITYDETISLAKTLDIMPQQVPLMLQYLHQRGKIVFFEGHDILSRLIVTNPTWLIQKISRVVDGLSYSTCGLLEMIEILHDKDLEKFLQKNGLLNVTSSEWLIAALQKLDVCVPFVDTKDEKRYLLPNLLEVGHPSADVWPDLPEWDERQITCDYGVRQIKPGLFTDLLLRLNSDGRNYLEIVADPAPVFLSHHIVFFTAVDVGGCEDCFVTRSRVRQFQSEHEMQDDILHKVHIQLHPRMDTIRVAVRGATPCCTMKSVLNFLELYLDDVPEEECDTSSDRTSISSHAFSSASPSVSHSGQSAASSDQTSVCSSQTSEEDEERQFFLLCPKCILLRHSNPERISYTSMSPKKKAICNKWHNLGSWTRAVTGDYRFNDQHVIPSTISCALTQLPEYEHPRLVMVLPPSHDVSVKDWYMFNRMKFLEGFEVHFLCEYTGYWHVTDDSGFRLNQSPEFIRRVGNQIPSILQLALPMVQIVNGVPEHGLNGRLLAPIVEKLVKTYDYLKNVDMHIGDPYVWLAQNKDRVVTMLTKVLANVSDGVPDLYFKVGNAINADMVFQLPSSGNRNSLARFLRIESSSGRFGPLRPLYVGREVRWLCDTHFEELRTVPSK